MQSQGILIQPVEQEFDPEDKVFHKKDHGNHWRCVSYIIGVVVNLR